MSPGIPAPRADRLARVLHPVRMRSTFYCRAELGDPWALAMPAIPDSITFHVLTTGTCWLHMPGADPLELQAGDLALVPHGLGHGLASTRTGGPGPRADLLPQNLHNEHYSELRHGGEGQVSPLICGVVSFDDPAARELARSLPPVLLVGRGSALTSASIRDTVRLMAEELAHVQPGGEAVATRLADIVVVQAIRAWLESDPETGAGWLRALRDERIGRALEAVHDDPGGDWTLERLARVATMSRSSFSARFTELVGESPIAYVTRWRMTLAHLRLREENVTVARLAADLGYQSEAAFHRAFTRVIGQAPGSVQRDR